MIKVSKNILPNQLAALGLEAGHNVLVRAAVKAMNLDSSTPADDLLDAVLSVIGPQGTVFGLTHSPSFPIWNKPKAYVYDRVTAPVGTGGFAAALVGRPDSYRSGHPTNSITGLGPLAESLLSDHDHRARSFDRRVRKYCGHIRSYRQSWVPASNPAPRRE